MAKDEKSASGGEGARPRPNVIWVFGDQHPGYALSCMGDPNATTPNIDRMAGLGAQFTAAVAGMPLCCPFRGSLLTSRYPHRCVPGHEYPLPDGMPTIAQPFREAGYRTGYFGKWHLDGWKERDGRAAMHIVPPERRGGFDEWVGYDNNNSQWDSWVHGGVGDEAFHIRLPGYETDTLTEMLIDFVSRQVTGPGGRERQPGEPAEQTAPFFAVLSVQPPHDPYVAPAEFMADYRPGRIELRPNVPRGGRIEAQARRELAGAYAQIENLDWNVGRLLTSLEHLGIDRDTYVVFFSDHGDMHGSHGQFKKMTAYEESIRIPLVVYHGESKYALQMGRPAAPVNHVDIAPTTLGLCGITAPEWMEGHDYSQQIVRGGHGGTGAPDSAYLQSVVPTTHGNSVDRPWRGLVTADGWKYTCLEGQPWMLFNLNEDPYEQANHALNSLYRAERKRLHERLAAWVADTGDEFNLPNL